MSMKLSRYERKQLATTNVGVRLLFDNSQARSSATIFLQWCLAKPLADYFRDSRVRNPMLFVEVKNPAGIEQRYLFSLASPQEVMQFHAPGTHTIKARIVWGAKLKAMRNALLGKRRGNYYTFEQFLGERSDKREFAIGLKCFGDAELALDVPAEFFAPQLSARKTWWINLMFPGIAQNSCSIRRRKWFAYSLQPPLVVLWALLSGIWRLLIGIFFGVLCGLRVDLKPIFHPFTQSFTEVYFDKENHTSWMWKRSDGTERTWGDAALLFTPIIHLVLSLISIWILAGNDLNITGGSFGITYVLVIVAVVLVVLVIAGINLVLSKWSNWWVSALERTSAWFMRDKWERLLCTTAPAQGLRAVGYTPRLLYQRVVGAYCKPVAT